MKGFSSLSFFILLCGAHLKLAASIRLFGKENLNLNYHSKLNLNKRDGSIASDSDIAVERTDYDYIICGGGVGGCILANRLSESNPDANILLLEAGKAKQNSGKVKIPAKVVYTFRSDIDWSYESIGTDHCNGKNIFIPRGKSLGGSSCINVMLVNRGDKNDYNEWEQQGAENWGADDVLPYFKNSEDYKQDGNPVYHSNKGLYQVTDVDYQNNLSRLFFQACIDSGLKYNGDFNDWDHDQEGFGRFKVSQCQGRRWTAATSHLKAAQSRQNGLRVRSSVTVNKINLDEKKQATGVEIKDMFGRIKKINCKSNGEVLVCGGAINSPKLLQLSGIGPKAVLSKANVECKVNLSGVGKNLQDHPAVVITRNVKKGLSATDDMVWRPPIGKALPKVKAITNWLVGGRGALTSPGCDHGAFYRTDKRMKSPDVQYRFVAARGADPDGVISYIKIANEGAPVSGLTLQVLAARPKSVGSVNIQSNDPDEKPAVDLGFLSNAADVASLVKGVKKGREILKSIAFEDVLEGDEIWPGNDLKSDAQIEKYVRTHVHTANAIVGTCKIGRASDKNAVVDNELRVHGTSNLRVVDASVMPKLPGGQTASSTVMIAERAAEMILKEKMVALA
jgi:choline dehydrogenase-like flavoprotein